MLRQPECLDRILKKADEMLIKCRLNADASLSQRPWPPFSNPIYVGELGQEERTVIRIRSVLSRASERILLHGQQETPLTPKVFETLLLLVENSGRSRKEELLQAILARQLC